MTTTSQTDKLLVTSREAAAMLSISERTLWTLTDRGAIPRVTLGRSVRYSVDALRAFIARKTGEQNGEVSAKNV